MIFGSIGLLVGLLLWFFGRGRAGFWTFLAGFTATLIYTALRTH